MTSSVGTKVRKKQLPLQAALPAGDRQFEHALLNLENVCLRILESRFAANKEDMDGLYWQQRFKNIVTPISLALVEYRGPRRFHYHYRHRIDDESVLHPVLEPAPVETLAQRAESALKACRSDLVGIQERPIVNARRMLENALQMFLARYREYSVRVTQ